MNLYSSRGTAIKDLTQRHRDTERCMYLVTRYTATSFRAVRLASSDAGASTTAEPDPESRQLSTNYANWHEYLSLRIQRILLIIRIRSRVFSSFSDHAFPFSALFRDLFCPQITRISTNSPLPVFSRTLLTLSLCPSVFVFPVPRDESRASNRLKSMLQKLCPSVPLSLCFHCSLCLEMNLGHPSS